MHTSNKDNILFFYVIFGSFVFLSISSYLLAYYQMYQTLMAWWSLLVLFIPLLIWSLNTSNIALKIFCLTSIFTQFTTLPIFFIYNSNEWVWEDVKPFNFTALEALPIIFKAAFFIYSVILFVQFFNKITLKKKKFNNFNEVTKNIALDSIKNFKVRDKSSIAINFTILFLIALLIPLNIWKYSQGIGLTGIAPPELPYKISGILFYLTNYFMPALLGYLYFHTKRGWSMALIFLAYAWVFGLSTLSKGAVLITMVPVIALAYIDKRYFMLVFMGLITLIAVFIASAARQYVHFGFGGVAYADTTINMFELIRTVLSNPESKIWNIDFLPVLISGIAARIEGFENLVLAQYYDPNAVIGSSGFALRMFWANFVNFDADAHHIEWVGNTLPEGFYNGGSLISTVIIMSNDGILWIIIGALITAFMLTIIEKITNKFVYNFNQLYALKTPIIFVLTLLFFTESSASRAFLFILFVLTSANLFSSAQKN